MILVQANQEQPIYKEMVMGYSLLFSLFTLDLIFCLPFMLLPVSIHCQCIKKPIIFNFGDSNSDTGGYADGLGFNFAPPNGRTYFHQPAGRLSDGRLMIDFLCKPIIVLQFSFAILVQHKILLPCLNRRGLPKCMNHIHTYICMYQQLEVTTFVISACQEKNSLLAKVKKFTL